MSVLTTTDRGPTEVRNPSQPQSSWERCGYLPISRHTYRRGPYAAHVGDKWLTIEASADARRPTLGNFGAWKPLDADRDVFELPIEFLKGPVIEADGESSVEPVAQLSAWLEASRRNELPADWKPPEAAPLRKSVPPGAWSLQVGAHARPIELDLTPQRAAVRTTLAATTEPLSHARYEYLRRKVEFENEHRRWIRLGLAGRADRPTVIAEIDLTGCPIAWFDALLHPALWALRRAAEHLLPTVVLMVSTRVCCESWEHSLP